MSTSTDPVRQRMAAANPANTEADPPGEVMSAAVLLAMIDDRSGAMTHKADSQEQGSSVATRRALPKWAAAFAAGFVVVLVVGISIVLLSRDGDSLDLVAPVTTTTPTTVPDAPVTSTPDMAPLIAIDADQINYPLPDDETRGITVSDGMLWATTAAGIIRWDLEERDAVLFTSADGLPFTDGAAGRIAIAPDGAVWAVSWNRDLGYFDGTRWAEPAGYDQVDIVIPRCTPDEECLSPVTAMAVGPGGLLSLAVGEESLLQFDGIDWSVLPVTPTETHGGSAWATDMAISANGTLWVASWEELLSYDGDTWVRFTDADGLPSGMINSVAVAPNGDVWVGTADEFEGDAAGGVARFDGDAWNVFDGTDGLLENAVTALAIGSDGIVWTVHGSATDLDSAEESAPGGISRFDGTTWSATTIADLGEGLGWGGAVVDDTGRLWVTSRWGVVGFDGTEATVLRFPDGTRPPINALPSTSQSQILPV
ncbi:MAG: two-component regulator propeller domain-containing protein, partial [Actinomycetota bacterium]|nr:two-component regulator propeller domain-containing protein [Actinomycetota bacterium]